MIIKNETLHDFLDPIVLFYPISLLVKFRDEHTIWLELLQNTLE